MSIYEDDGHPLPTKTDHDLGDDLAVEAWHDWEEYKGIKYPVLWYTGDGDTEPCIWCGKPHHHGDLEGSRVPHCTDHTHVETPKGNRRSPDAKGMTRCTKQHRDYILRKKRGNA